MNQALFQTKNNEDLLPLFHEYATDLLKAQDQEVREALRRREIFSKKNRPLEAAYKISLKFGKNIPLKSIKKLIVKQIDAAAYFIRDFHLGVLGQQTILFHLHEIEIQIERNIQYGFIFESGKLLIQIPYWQLSFWERYIPYQKMKNLWHQGKHLNPVSPTRKVWWLFNPIGEFRSHLRTMLLLAMQKHILGIDKLLLKFGLADASAHPSQDFQDEVPKSQTFKENAIAFLKATVTEDKLGINLDLALKNQDDQTLVRLINSFKKNLTDPSQMEELIDTGVFSLQEVIYEEQSQVNIKMFGLVNVGNYHRIDVVVNLSSGYLKKYVELVPRKVEVKAIQLGFVNVYTIDDITVKPNFHGAIKLNFETAALEQALRELDLVK